MLLCYRCYRGSGPHLLHEERNRNYELRNVGNSTNGERTMQIPDYIKKLFSQPNAKAAEPFSSTVKQLVSHL